MNRPLPDRSKDDPEPGPPVELAQSTVSEIASWLVGQPLDTVERELIRQTLEACGGDRVAAAGVLGLSLPALRRKLTAYAVRGEPIDTDGGDEAKATRARKTKQPPAQNDPKPTIVEPEAALAQEQAPETAAAPSEEKPETYSATAAAVLAAASLKSETYSAAGAAALAEASAPWPQIPHARAEEPDGEVAAPVATLADAEPVVPRADASVPRAVPGVIVMSPPPAAARGKKASRRLPDKALLLGGGSLLVLMAVIGWGLLDHKAPPSGAVSVDRPGLQISINEPPAAFEQRIPVPAWVLPPERAASPGREVSPPQREIAVNKADAPPGATKPAAPAPTTVPPAAAPVRPAPAPSVAAKSAVPAPAVPAAPAPVRQVPAPQDEIRSVAPAAPAPVKVEAPRGLAGADIAQDTRMELGRADIAQDTRMELGRPDIALDTRMDLGRANIALDTRLDPGRPDIALDTRMDLAPANTAADTRLEVPALAARDDGPETTGALPPSFFVAPEEVPMPIERADPPVRRMVRPRPAQQEPSLIPPAPVAPAPAQTQKPETPFPNLFPFPNIFAPQKDKPAGDAPKPATPPGICCS